MRKDAFPDPLVFQDGSRVESPEEWRERRKEIIHLLEWEEYGEFPDPPDSISWKILQEDQNYCAGKAMFREICLTVSSGGREASFPFYQVLPKTIKNPMAFLHINFRRDVPDKYMPTEEILDGGFAVYSFGYQDVTSDNGDFTDGIASLFFENGVRKEHDPGKIALWAWAAMRVMDCICSMGEVNTNCVAVVGHSRLGKTALLTAALDERFAFAISNDSGCSGAAVSRNKRGERISDITERFPFWFCPKYREYSGREDALPFDQHWLTALIAPRNLYVASASQDQWADPEAEFLCCRLTDPVYRLLGWKGLQEDNSGRIGYHLREGTHYLSRYDWQKFMKFVESHAETANEKQTASAEKRLL